MTYHLEVVTQETDPCLICYGGGETDDYSSKLSHEVAGGILSLFFPFDPGSDGHGFRVSSLQLSESVGYCCYGGWVRVLLSEVC